MSLTKDFLGDNYEVVRRLSEGGMGIVYLVRHRHLETLRVVKVIREQYAHNPELQERFLREARTAIRLRHPKIAQIYDFSMTDDGSAFIVMEYIEGRTLQQLLRDEGPPPLDLALEIGRQVLEALDYLHGQGYVHRDISPDNLMLTKDFEDRRLVKLIDLGIAKRTGQEAGTQLTGHGMFLGKAKYSAPEAIEGKEVGAASDVYSFGAVLYELLTGLAPFDGQTFSQLLAAQLFKEPKPFSESDPQGRIPDILRRFVLKTLAKDASERGGSASELALRLEEIRRHKITVASLSETEKTHHLSPSELGVVPPPATEHVKVSAGSELEALAAAHVLVGKGQFREARAELRRVLDDDPDHTAAQRELKVVEEILEHQATARRQGEITRAAERIERHLDGGELEAAHAELDQAIASFGLGTRLQEVRDRLDQALAERDRRRRRSRIASLVSEAESLLKAGQWESATKTLEEVEAMQEADTEIGRRVAGLLEAIQARKAEEAERASSIRRRIASGHFDAVLDALTEAESRLGHSPLWAELRHELEDARRLEAEQRRQELEAKVAQAQRWLEQGDLTSAANLIDTVLESRPDDVDANRLKDRIAAEHLEREGLLIAEQAEVEIRNGDLEEARKILEQGEALLGDHPALIRALGRLASAEQEAHHRRTEEVLTAAARCLEAGALDAVDEHLVAVQHLGPLGEKQAAQFDVITRELRAIRARREEKAVVEQVRELLDSGDTVTARREVENRRPEAPGEAWLATERRLAQAERDARIGDLLDEAHRLRNSERWRAALAKVEEALGLDAEHFAAGRLQQELEAELRRREEERRERELADVVEILTNLLAKGDVRSVGRGLETARRTFGESAELLRLKQSYEEADAALRARRAERLRQVVARVWKLAPVIAVFSLLVIGLWWWAGSDRPVTGNAATRPDPSAAGKVAASVEEPKMPSVPTVVSDQAGSRDPTERVEAPSRADLATEIPQEPSVPVGTQTAETSGAATSDPPEPSLTTTSSSGTDGPTVVESEGEPIAMTSPGITVPPTEVSRQAERPQNESRPMEIEPPESRPDVVPAPSPSPKLPAPEPAMLEIQASPRPGATVAIDGGARETLDRRRRFELEPGRHRLVFRLGPEEHREELELSEGQRRRVPLPDWMLRAPEPPPETPEITQAPSVDEPPPFRRGDTITEVGPGVVPPERMRLAQPEYPQRARQRRIRRPVRVELAVLVDENGRVTRSVVKSVGKKELGFEEAAKDAASRSLYRPATRDGVAGKMWTDLVIEFRPR